MTTPSGPSACRRGAEESPGERKLVRSASLKRRSLRRPTRRACSSPLSLHRRTEAWLTRRKFAASAVLSNLTLIVVSLGEVSQGPELDQEAPESQLVQGALRSQRMKNRFAAI